MHNIEQQHHNGHQCCVENVEPDLTPEQIAVITLDILDDTKDRAHHNENTGSVKCAENSAPRHKMRLRTWRGRLLEAAVKSE